MLFYFFLATLWRQSRKERFMKVRERSKKPLRGLVLLAALAVLLGSLLSVTSLAASDCACDEGEEPTSYRYEIVDGLLRKCCAVCHTFDDGEFYNVKTNHEQLVMTEALLALGLDGTAVRTQMKEELASLANTTASIGYRFFEMELTRMQTGGASEAVAPEEIAGASVEVSIALGSLDGFDEAIHALYVVHLFADNAYGRIAGETESFSSKDGTLTVENGSARFVLNGLSPVVIGFACANHVDENGDHVCDNACGEAVVECVDKNGDGRCDVCNAALSRSKVLLAVLIAVLLIAVSAVLIAWREARRRQEERTPVLDRPIPQKAPPICSLGKRTPCYSGCAHTPAPVCGCPASETTVSDKGYNTLASVNPAAAAEWHPCKNGGLKPCDVAPGSSRTVFWQCRCGHEWASPVYIRNAGRGCPYCAKQK